jgi:hypothetical protein
MDRKRVALWMPWIVGAGFCLVAAMKLVFLFQASDEKDVPSGRVEPILFAPALSRDWDYVTHGQIVALTVVMAVALLLAAAMFTSRWWAGSATDDPPADAAPGDPADHQPDHHSSNRPAATRSKQDPRRRSFGRARH